MTSRPYAVPYDSFYKIPSVSSSSDSPEEDILAVTRSFYKDLYVLEEGSRWLCINQVTGHVLVRKKLVHYSTGVYDYLSTHSHPGIPAIEFAYQEGKTLYVYESLVQGRTLEEALKEDSLTREDRLRILVGLCDILTFLHSASPPIIHRDIKPSNVMLTEEGAVKLIDYDAARICMPGDTRDTVLLGTVGSAAPEQFGFGPSDARTDIYGMGVLIRTLLPEDRRCGRIADRCCHLDADARYQTAASLKKALTGRAMTFPGFRSPNLLFRLGALLIYIFLGWCMATADVQGVEGAAMIWLNRAVMYIIILTWAALLGNWEPLTDRLPFLWSKSVWLRLLARILYGILALMIWAFFLNIVEAFF